MKLGKLRHESKYLAIRYFYTKKNWSIEWMCRQLEISRAAYYKWLHREIPYGAKGRTINKFEYVSYCGNDNICGNQSGKGWSNQARRKGKNAWTQVV